MSIVLKSLLVLGLCTVISCSRGGAGDDAGNGAGGNGAGNVGKTQGGGLTGEWNDGTNTLVVTGDSLSFSGQCTNGQVFNLQSKISVNGNTITIQENKQSGCIQLTKGQSIPYTLKGDKLTITAGGEQLEFTRVGGGDDGNQGGKPAFTFFENANCTGRTFNFTKGTDCTRLTGSPVKSIQSNGQCTDFQGQTIDAGSLCQQINGQ